VTAPAVSSTTSSASPATSSVLTGLTASSGGTHHMTELSFDQRRTLGYSGSHDQTGSAAPADRSVASKLALLSQYSASSFATNPVTSTGNPAQGHWGDSGQTLAKPHG